MNDAAMKYPGKMVAVIGLDVETVKDICFNTGKVEIANLNCPDQIVISGDKEAVDKAKEDGRWDRAYENQIRNVRVPDDLLIALRENKTAFDNFEGFPPYARFMYIHWINEAKREDTRKRRIYTVVDRSEKNQKPGIDLRISKQP